MKERSIMKPLLRWASALFTVCIILCFSWGHFTSRAQEKPGRPESAEILELPQVRFHKPKLTLQNALKKAENYIETKKIPIEEYFLIEARFIVEDPDEGKHPGWRFWWIHQDQALGHYVELFVSMEGEVKRLPSM